MSNIILPSEIITFDQDLDFDSEKTILQRDFLVRYLDSLVLQKNMTFRDAITLYYIFEESTEEENDIMIKDLEEEVGKKSALKNLLLDDISSQLELQDENVATTQFFQEINDDEQSDEEFYETLLLLYDGQIPAEIQKQYNEYIGLVENNQNNQNSEVLALDTLTQALQYKVKNNGLATVNKPLTVEELINKVERSRDAKRLEKQQVAQAVSSITAVSSKPKAPSNLNNLN